MVKLRSRPINIPVFKANDEILKIKEILKRDFFKTKTKQQTSKLRSTESVESKNKNKTKKPNLSM